jgi:hypothetical protein
MWRREQKPRVQPARKAAVEGCGSATGERHPAAAPLRLRFLDPTARNDNAADTDDTGRHAEVLRGYHDDWRARIAAGEQ